MKKERPANPQPDRTELNAAGMELFTSHAALREWMRTKADWADGLTPDQLIASGRTDAVVKDLRGLAHGNIL